VRRLRFWLVSAGSVVALGSVVTIVGVWIGNFKFDLPSGADKVTRINTAVAVSAYIAAIIAALFALVAYWQTSGLPSLKPVIYFLPFDSASPVFGATPKQSPPWVDPGSEPFPIGPFPAPIEQFVPMLDRMSSDTILTVELWNTTKYAARNPGLRIRFDGLLFNGVPAGWTAVDRWGEKNGLKAIQWDGGTENIVHGKWSRAFPIVGFNEIVVLQPRPALVVTVVADGCRPEEFEFPLNVNQGPPF
jgi:hypothetical protein